MELRPYQQASVLAFWEWFRANPTGAPLLVLPTGAGKSHVLAAIAKAVAEKGIDRRVLIIAPRRELLVQNREKLLSIWPFGSVGVYSAGLKKRDTTSQVLFAGIHSVFKRTAELGRFSLVLFDEAHLVPSDGMGMYRTLVKGLMEQNPAVRFAGCSATPYRLDSGLLTQGKEPLFTDIAYDVPLVDLIRQGHLSPLVSKSCVSRPDLSKVQIRAGEYVAEQMESAFNRLDLVEAALAEVVSMGADRKSWLIFSSGVSHAERIGEVLARVGIKAAVLTGETAPLFRQQMLDDFKAGRLKALVNCDVLTTGFDHPGIDLIAVLRATKSTALWVQICGRGCRKAPGKKDCLVLDFGDNALTHGPLDKIRITYRTNPLTGKKEGRVDAPPMKECPACRSVALLSARECPDCGAPSPEPDRLNHQAVASSAPVMSKPMEVEVFRSDVCVHQARNKPLPVMKVEHVIGDVAGVGVSKVFEWVCLEHEGLALRKAKLWWKERSTTPEKDWPDSVTEGVTRAKAGELRRPKRVLIQQDDKWWRVVRVLEFYPEAEVVVDEDQTFFEETGINL